MSASKQKKLRREMREDGLDNRREEQRLQAKKNKRSKVLTTVIAIVVVIAIIAVTVLNTNLFYNKVTAVSINGENYTAAEFNYYYFNSYYSMVNTYGDYIYYLGLDTSLPLDEQTYADGQTWADYFQEAAIATMTETQMLCDEAEKAGFTMPDDYKQTLSANLTSIADAAAQGGFANVDQYIVAAYGRGSDYETISRLMERDTLAAAYQQEVYNSFEYSSEELDAHYQENADSYDYVSYLYYFCDGNADEENGIDAATAMANAEELANSIIDGVADEEAFKNRVSELADSEVSVTNTQGSGITTTYSEFLLSADRQYGDTGVFQSDYGWYAVMYLDRSDNHYNTVAVRHILIKAEADADGNYTEEAKAAALEQVENIRDEFEAGDMTEESFAALAEQYSEDSGSNTNGGLYEGIYKNQMVENFNDFCFDGSRKPGDIDIVYGESSSYAGYHLVFFVGAEDTLYSDTIADSALREAEYTAWFETALEGYSSSTGTAIRFAR